MRTPCFHKRDDPTSNTDETGEVRMIAPTIPHDHIDTVAGGLSPQAFADKNRGKRRRAA